MLAIAVATIGCLIGAVYLVLLAIATAVGVVEL